MFPELSCWQTNTQTHTADNNTTLVAWVVNKTFCNIHCEPLKSSDAADLIPGGRFYSGLFCRSRVNAAVEELVKFVHIFRSYCRNKSGTLLWIMACMLFNGLQSVASILASPPNKKYRGESIIFAPETFSLSVVPGMTNALHIIMHFCSKFWRLRLYQISNFSGWSWGSLQHARRTLSCWGSLPPPREPYPPLSPSGFVSLGRCFIPLPVREKLLPLKINLDWRHWLQWILNEMIAILCSYLLY